MGIVTDAELQVTDAEIEPDNTVLYLVPKSSEARKVVKDCRNARLWVQTRAYGPALRVTLGCANPPYLIRLRNDNNGIHLGGKMVTSGCDLFFNADSGELVLYDNSPQCTTSVTSQGSLTGNGAGPVPLMVHGDKQCAIVLSPHPTTTEPRWYTLKMGKRVFHVYSPFRDNSIALRSKEPYSRRPSAATAWPTPPQPEYIGQKPTPLLPRQPVHFAEIEKLGQGGEFSEVNVVAIATTGSYFACKTCALGSHEWKSMHERRKDVARQLEFVRQAYNQSAKSCIVPWHFYQFRARYIDIFMPIYWCSLADLINNNCFSSVQCTKALAMAMLRDISTALALLAAQEPPVIHRDVKPENILYMDGRFSLADFGVCKSVNNTHTNTGTEYFKSPEVRSGGDHTTAIDVFSLGLTLAACLSCRPLSQIYDEPNPNPQLWAEEAKKSLIVWRDELKLGDNIAGMLRNDAKDRPAAALVRDDAVALLARYEKTRGPCTMPARGFAEQCAANRRSSQPTVPRARPHPQCDTHSSVSSHPIDIVPVVKDDGMDGTVYTDSSPSSSPDSPFLQTPPPTQRQPRRSPRLKEKGLPIRLKLE